MRFTEHEMTVALTATTQRLNAAKRRSADPIAAWESMTRLERYYALDAIGQQVLSALMALPEVEVAPGTRPTFTDDQIVTAVTETLGRKGGWLRRKATIAARTALLKSVVADLPIRHDPNTLVVPDHL